MRVVATLLFVLWASVAGAKNLYVNPGHGSASDATTYINNSASLPWVTVARAAWGSTDWTTQVSGQAAQAGDVVIISGGTYTTSGLTLGDWGNSDSYRFSPLYNPVNSGSVGLPITFQAATGTNYTLQHSRICPTVGAGAGKHYIIWDGFIVDEANAPKCSSTGVATVISNNSGFQNCTIIGTNSLVNDNHPGAYFEDANFGFVKNCTIRHIYTLGVRGANEAGIMLYDSNDSLFEHNDISDTGMGISIKGIHGGDTQLRTIARYNLIYDCLAAFELVGSDQSAIYQNIMYDIGSSLGMFFWVTSLVEGLPNGWIVNNTAYNLSSGADGAFVFNSSGTTNWGPLVVWNNIISTTPRAFNVGGGATAMPPGNVDFQHDVYHAVSGTFAQFATTYNTTTWQAIPQDNVAPALATATPNFTNTTTHDFHPLAAYIATQGRVVHSIGGVDGATIPAGAYITGSECIGLEANCTPAATTGLIRLRRTGSAERKNIIKTHTVH